MFKGPSSNMETKETEAVEVTTETTKDEIAPEGNGLSEQIVDLALEIIYLVTGKDYIVVKKPSERATKRGKPSEPGGSCETQIPGTDPPPNPPPNLLKYERDKDQKILEVTNKIIQLLTGEVHVRCDDVTVHFSTEEWECVREHEDLYKDAVGQQLLESTGIGRSGISDEAYAIMALDSDATDEEFASDLDIDHSSDASSNSDHSGPPIKRSRAALSIDPYPDTYAQWVPAAGTVPEIPPFTGSPGIHPDVSNFKASQFMGLFMGDDFWEHITFHTNLYAAQHLATDTTSYVARHESWNPTTVYELRKFWALTMIMGVIRKPSIRSYWSTDPIFSHPVFTQTMKRGRYEMLLRFLHFNDDTQCLPKDDPLYDRLFKIRPLITHLQTKFAEVYTPEKEICISESLMKYKGKLEFKQYFPSMRSRYGVKLYKLCEGASGYTHGFRVHEGKDGNFDLPGCPDYLETSGKIVWDLVRPLLSKGYHLYVNSPHTSVSLFKLLFCLDTGACGTIRPSSKGFPKKLAAARLKWGASLALRQEELLAVKFRDRKDLCMLTTIHDHSTVPDSGHRKADVVRKPACVKAYNKHMGAVDSSDQLLQPYLIMRKSNAWYKKVAIYMMQVATHNAYLIFKKAKPTNNCTFLDFQLQFIKELLVQDYQGAPVPVPSGFAPRLGGVHFPFKIPPSAKRATVQKRCRVCYAKGRRKDTTYYCPDCPDKPGLCVGSCFKTYHTVADY